MENGRTVAIRDAPKKRELVFFQDNCTGCGMCCEVCISNAIRLGPTGAIARGVVDAAYLAVNEGCVLCGLCARICMFDALALYIGGVREEYDALGSVDVKGGCKLCKLCEEVCPRNAVVVHRTMPGMKELQHGEFKIDMERCIYCGICQDICPTEALTVERGGLSAKQRGVSEDTPARFERIELDEDKCVLCRICARACPTDALTVARDACDDKIKITGEVMMDNNTCSWCGWCEEVCPEKVIEVQKPIEGDIEIDVKMCQGCGTCVEICPCDALYFPLTEYIKIEESYAPDKGWSKPIRPRTIPVAVQLKVNKQRCIFCGACANTCPIGAIKVTRKRIRMMDALPKPTQKALSKLLQSTPITTEA